VVDTLLVDQETIYAPRQGNDRLLLGLKGSLNEYELDLLRQRSLAARHEKARRGELIVMAPVGYLKTDDHRLERESGWCSQSSGNSEVRGRHYFGSWNIICNYPHDARTVILCGDARITVWSTIC
jgi:hypothetical protein